jgi:hypothetical protein
VLAAAGRVLSELPGSVCWVCLLVTAACSMKPENRCGRFPLKSSLRR